MAIVIKKKVSLDFLGEEYKDAYLEFQSIPLKDFDEMGDRLQNAEANGEKPNAIILEILKKYFVDGKFPGMDKLVASDLDGLDATTAVQCFATFTGQDLDPKVTAPEESASSLPSSTEQVQES